MNTEEEEEEESDFFNTSLIFVSSKRVTSWFFNVSRAFCSLRPIDWNRAIRDSLSEDTAISQKQNVYVRCIYFIFFSFK